MGSDAHAPNLTVCQRAPGCKPAPWTFNRQARREGRAAIHFATDNLHSQQAPVVESAVEVAATGPCEVQRKIRARAGIELPRIYLTHALLKTGSIFKFGRDVGLQEPKLVQWNAVEPIHQIQGHCPFFVAFISPTHLHIYIAPAHPHCHSFASTLSFFLRIFSLTSVHVHLRTLTSADLPLHLHTSAHLYHTCASTLSLLHIRPLFLFFYISF